MTNKTVEAVARAIYVADGHTSGMWDEEREEEKDLWRSLALAAIKAHNEILSGVFVNDVMVEAFENEAGTDYTGNWIDVDTGIRAAFRVLLSAQEKTDVD